MVAHVDHVVYAWKEWGIQALVMFSLALQVALLVLAKFRRRINSGVLKFFIWSAYILADSTAVYVLGHMSLSVTTRSPSHLQLMAFWAPFLLLHLGGQDNITAYAIEDNKLWLRHLQTFVVQVAAAAYVLYESSILNGSLRSELWWATVLMFAVGAVKYAERVWALRCAGTSSFNRRYEEYGRASQHLYMSDYVRYPVGELRDTEALLLMAHRLLNVPKNLLKEPSVSVYPHHLMRHLRGKNFYRIVEMELSLMHDVFYTKAEVMHTWSGLCIHVFLTLATSVAFLLFYHHHNRQRQLEGYSRVDVTVTYVLLAGALVLEMISVLRAMLSSWTLASLLRNSWNRYHPPTPKHKLLATVASIISYLRRLLHVANWRRRFYWSDSMGQHNLAQLCAQSKGSRRSKIATRMGVEYLWNTHAYSSSIAVPTSVKRLLYEGSWRLKRQKYGPNEVPDAPTLKLGRDLLSKCLSDDADTHALLSSLDKYILTWHIATDMYLDWWKKQDRQAKLLKGDEELADEELAEAVQALSNYMLFLLASRPYMLPPGVSRNPYVAVCFNLITEHTGSTETVRWGRDLGCKLIPEEGPWTYLPTSESESEGGGGGGGEEGGEGGGVEEGEEGEEDPEGWWAKSEDDLEEGRCTYPTKSESEEVVEDEEEEEEEIQNQKEEEKKKKKKKKKNFRIRIRIRRREEGQEVRDDEVGDDIHKEEEKEPHQEMLKQIALVWAEMVCYAGHKCSASSHAKQLNNGVELITIAALLVEHAFNDYSDSKEPWAWNDCVPSDM